MAGIYDLLPLLTSYTMKDGATGSSLSTWEVDGSVLKTTSPVSATRPNTVSAWRPYPWLSGAGYDVSGIASVDDYYRIRYYGTISKATAFSSVDAFDVFTTVVDEGDHYSFSSDWSPATYLPSYPEINPTTWFKYWGPSGSGGTSISDLEVEVTFEIEILDPPPPEPVTVRAEWGYSYFGTSTACETDISEMTDLERVSATLTYYEDSANFTTVQKHCAYGVEWDQDPAETYEIDVETLNLSGDFGNTIILTSFTHDGLFEFRNAMLLIEVIATIDGAQYPTTLTAVRYPWG